MKDENKRKKHTEETKKRISESLRGVKHSPDRIQKNRGSFKVKGKDHYKWKGSDVGYHPLHQWVSRHKKCPGKCERCGVKNKRLEWANKSRKYLRNLSDWIRLCCKCHREYDR